MLTDLQMRRLERLFDRYDSNGDGLVVQADIDSLVQRRCAAFDVTPGSDQWQEVTKRSDKLWQSLEGRFDYEGDIAVSKEGWLATHEDSDFVEKVAIPLAQATFELGDVDQDGRVGRAEWMTAPGIAGLGQMEAQEVFEALDDDGDGYITTDEYLAALHDFYLSGDPESAGSLLAG